MRIVNIKKIILKKKMNNPIVSIIVPVYNTEQYVKECVNSICNQTIEDIEIICVNDGSTDNSLMILKEIAQYDSRIVIIDQKNQGLSASRNNGNQLAKGKYIYYVDSDDYIDINALELLVCKAEREELDITIIDAVNFYENEAMKEDPLFHEDENVKKKEYDSMSGQELASKMFINGDFRSPAVLFFYNTEFLKKNRICFYEGILHEDIMFTFSAMMHAKKAGCINLPLYKRRVRDNSIMTTKLSEKNINGYLTTFVEYIKLIDDFNCDAARDAVIGLYNEIIDRNRTFVDELGFNYCNDIEYESMAKEILHRQILKIIASEQNEINLKNKIELLEKNNLSTERKLIKCKKQLDKLQIRKKRIEHSYSYKIGKIITFVPRKCKKLIIK